MTPIDGFIVAVIAGWLVPQAGRAAVVVMVPWLAVLGVQSWQIAAGMGVSPPATVTQFPQLVGYWLLQALALGLALGIAGQLSRMRASGALFGLTAGDLARREATAFAITSTVSVAIVAAFLLDRSVFDPGSVIHHSAQGHPPLLGLLGMALSVAGFVAVAAVSRRRRHMHLVKSVEVRPEPSSSDPQ